MVARARWLVSVLEHVEWHACLPTQERNQCSVEVLRWNRLTAKQKSFAMYSPVFRSERLGWTGRACSQVAMAWPTRGSTGFCRKLPVGVAPLRRTDSVERSGGVVESIVVLLVHLRAGVREC